MKQTLIRLILFVLFLLLATFVVKGLGIEPAIAAFIATYILEGAVTQIANK